MAGTVPSLSLATQYDKNGNLLRSGKIYWYQANTLIPQAVYSDSGLTVLVANPYTLDGSARAPEWYCADGSIRVRVVDSTGVVQVDAKAAIVIGPSSGGGGGGSSVDPTAIFQTGDCIWLDQAGTRTGWVRDNGRTIGSATSGASERANSDCNPLFLFLWNTYSDARCPVVGGRGASAAADWAANKVITLPDKRGYVPGGLDDMGNVAANRYTGVPVVLGDTVTAGSLIGEAEHTLGVGELPTITPAGDISNHITGGTNGGTGTVNEPPGNSTTPLLSGSTPIAVNSTFNGTPFGGNGAHNTTQLTVLGTFYRKL